MFKNANEIIEIIEKRKNRGYGLEHFKKYMESIQNPHHELCCIHVAGTNGKGSTTNTMRSILQVAGYRVGTFTSPYMITHLDRIRINDAYIKEEDFVNLTNQYYDSFMAWDLSMFEIDMALACLYFKQEKVDVCIFEVGLGGRLDFTNIIQPIASVITNIGMDHMELLGDTYEKIAEEKAGIIKHHADVFTAEKKEQCLTIFQQHALKHQVELHQTTTITCVHTTPTICFDYKAFKQLTLASSATYQMENAALSIDVLTHLREKGMLSFEDEHIYKGLLKAVWIGRFEVMQTNPLLILDGAHNEDGIKALVSSLKGKENVSIIFSALRDKNFERMIDILEDITQDITICHFENERAIELQEIKKRSHIQFMKNYECAIEQALKEKTCIVITGSLYFISEVRKYLLRN